VGIRNLRLSIIVFPNIINCMKESSKGMAKVTRENILPSDAKLYQETDSYKLYVSKGEKRLILDTTSYHPGMLQLDKSDLENILKEFYR